MGSYYELINLKEGLNLNINLHSVNNYKLHLHNEIELLFVLKGSINLVSGDNKYQLRENDYILINSSQVHSTAKTNEENICLAMQFHPHLLDKIYPGFSKINFSCKSFEGDEKSQEKHDRIRHYIANIIWQINKKDQGFEINIGILALKIAKDLLINFKAGQLEEDTNGADRNIKIKRIMTYIDENIEEGVTLEDVAENEGMSSYYISRFIKNNIGISFQEYKNHKRLDKALDLLTNSDKTITEIALLSGFPSAKSLNNIFKQNYSYSPSEFRKRFKTDNENDYFTCNEEKIKSKSYFDVERNEAFSKLFTYLEAPISKGPEITREKTIAKEIKVNLGEEGRPLNPYWKKLMTFGRAAEGLRQDWRDQIREIQEEIGFDYVRFHGIFSDDMMICNLDEENNIIYNWSYVDNLFDFLIEINLKPFVGLNFMPSEIKKSHETMYWWKANISQPKDIKLWTNLVEEFLRHCINRYGLQEVESWYFEVWNEPELEYLYWIGGKEEYFEFYRETALAVKSLSNKLRVGGPSITHQALKDGPWLEDFIIYSIDKDLPLDFISLHIYPESYGMGEKENPLELLLDRSNFDNINYNQLKAKLKTRIKNIYFDENHTFDTINNAIERIEALLPKRPEIHITEWSATSLGRNLISDTCYTGTYIVKNILQSLDRVDSIGYWTFTDIMEELKAGISPFHGGFGLINRDGIKKPGYYAYYFLSKLGDEILAQDQNFIVTRKDQGIQILAYNFAYFDDLFLKGDTSALSYKDRYKVFQGKGNIEKHLHLKGLEGKYKITRYQLNRDHGSAFDEWLKLGSPENMTQEEIKYLKMKSHPRMIREDVHIEDIYRIKLSIPLHGLELIRIDKIY